MINETLKNIKGLDEKAAEFASRRLDSLTKPLGSLGKLEEMVIRLAGITGKEYPKTDKKAVIIMCADNGVCDENVSSCPKSVTSQVTRNFTRGITGINVIAKHADAETYIIDIGVDDNIECEGVICKKIRRGTSNMAIGPAMSREEAIRAIETGIDAVKALKDRGFDLLGTGEMGIGNTTTSSAVTSVLAGFDVSQVVGKGAGLTKEALENKINVIKRAININRPDPNDAIDVMAKVGGFDIAGLCGCFIGAASFRVPILIDGFISATAALCAFSIEPKTKDFIFASHCSAEPGMNIILDKLKMQPMLTMGMRLGEGTGAALAFNIFDVAIALYENMGTFGDAEIVPYKPLD